MYVRVWEYDVEPGQLSAFLAVYGAAGAWVKLFARADGYAGTDLFRDVDQANRFLTVDRWTNAGCWQAFLDRWADEYHELDHQLRWLASGGRPVVEGAAQAD
jgi:heme-degrading monooxygenase HmoA